MAPVDLFSDVRSPLPVGFSRDHAHEGKLAKRMGNVHPVADNETIGASKPHKLGFDIQLAAAALIQEHGNRNASRSPVQSQITRICQRVAGFQNVVDKKDIPALHGGIDIPEDSGRRRFPFPSHSLI